MATNVSNVVSDMVRKYDALIQKQFSSLDARLDNLENPVRPCSFPEADNTSFMETGCVAVVASIRNDSNNNEEICFADQDVQIPQTVPDRDNHVLRPGDTVLLQDLQRPRDTSTSDNNTATQSVSPGVPAESGVDPSSGDTVVLQGLQSAADLNGLFGNVVGLDRVSERYMIKVSARTSTIKVKRHNLAFPASCPKCGSEVSSNHCFDCGFGCCSKLDTICNSSPPSTLPPPLSGELDAIYSHTHVHPTASALAESLSAAAKSQ